MSDQSVPQDVSEVIDRRNESRKHMQQNYWPEWINVYRYSKCLTEKIMITDKNGNQSEDTTRTNVCMPETSLSIRRKTARLTASPPQINYTAPDGQEEIGEKLTAWAYQQFDRSGEYQQHRRMVNMGITYGWSVSKLWWDTVEVDKTFQRFFVGRDGQTVAYRDRAGLMRMQGADDDEIEGAVGEKGPDLSDPEVSQAIAKYGNSVKIPQRVSKFEGPISRNCFIGDVFIEPGCLALDESGWVVENYFESEIWLKKMLKRRYYDDDGKECQVFDPKACQDLLDMGTWNPNQGSQQPYDLRTSFRTTVLNQQVPLFPTKLLPGKRFDILEQHSREDDGKMWITWIGNERYRLGRMPYPWDLYGRYCYTEFVPLFDIISAIGDSIPRLHRFLQSLHNATVGQRKDLIRNLLKPIILQRAGEDVADEQLERAFYRLILVRDPNSFKPFMDSPALGTAIQGANEEEQQIMRMWALSDPSLNNVEAGSDTNPQAGKTATTAVLAAKSADALTQFELDSLSYYLKQSGEKKLCMLQQNEREVSEPYKVGAKYSGKVKALTQRYGKAATICIYPDEIQQDFEVEPEAMSMLSADDDIRRNAAQTMMQAASAMPGVFDPHYVARFFAGTIRGVDPDQAVPPPQPPPPIPPKVNVAVAVKWPELPAQARLAAMSAMGMPVTPEVEQEEQLKDSMVGLQQASAGADAADNIMSPSTTDQLAQQQAQQQQTSQQQRVDSQTAAADSAMQSVMDHNLKTQELKIKDKVAGIKAKPNGKPH